MDSYLEKWLYRFDDVQARNGHCLLLSGEAGIGTSRLLRQFVAGVHTAGIRMLQSHCLENDRSRAYGPLLLISEDIQRSDEISLEFLHLLTRRLDMRPLFLLLTTRPQADSPAPAQFLSQPNREKYNQLFIPNP